MVKALYRSQKRLRRQAVADLRKVVSRVMDDSGVRHRDILAALDMTSRTNFRRRFVECSDAPVSIHLSDIILLSRSPATAEFARRLLLELLAGLDEEQLRVQDIRRFAASGSAEQRERAIRVLQPLAEKLLGLTTPHFSVSTAEVSGA